MGDFEAGLVIESQIAQRLPIFFDHAGRGGTEFLC
jgi:hypothetical protein